MAALVAGFLLGRQDGGDAPAERTESEPNAVVDAVARVRQRAMPGWIEGGLREGRDDAGVDWSRIVGGEASGADETTGPTETTTGPDASSPDEVTRAEESDEIDAAVSDLSAPTVRGMPILGVGTDQDWTYDECFESIREALRLGYRHVDATERREAYYNETPVGDAIEELAVPREEVFVATKVSPADLDYDHVLTSAEESLEHLGMEYLDLLYVHWPTGEYEPDETLEAFAELRREGLVEAIGVSNFTVELLEEARDILDAPIVANQVEMHPLLPQDDLLEYCQERDVTVVAYAPLLQGEAGDVDALAEIADDRDTTPEAVSLAWLNRRDGVLPIPKATGEAHLRANFDPPELTDEEVARIDAIDRRERLIDPDGAAWDA